MIKPVYYKCNENVCKPVFIVEQTAIPDSDKVISVYDKYNAVEAKVILQTFDEDFNHNGRIYDKASYEVALEEAQERIKKGRLWGELDHPINYIQNPLRLFSVLAQDGAFVIKKAWIEGDKVLGIIKTLPTFKGRELKNLLLCKDVNIGFSLRADADEIPIRGGTLAKVKKIVTWDAVVNPSHEKTEVVNMKPLFESILFNDGNNQIFKNNRLVMESADLKDLENYLQQRSIDFYFDYLMKEYYNIK